MTRNNLGDHLSWLLQHVELSRPTGPPLPVLRDSFDTEGGPIALLTPAITQDSATDAPFNPSGNTSRTVSAAQPPARPPVIGATSFSIINGPGGAFHNTEVASRVEEMARLTSTTKSKKPSLVVKQQQNPHAQLATSTPSSTRGVGPLQQAYSASLTVSNARTHLAAATPVPLATLSRASKQRTPVSRAYLDLDDEYESVDLTSDDIIGFSPSGQVRIRETPKQKKSSARGDVLSGRGKKRKSNEISQTAAKFEEIDDDDFPDVHDLVELEPPPSKTARPSSSISPKKTFVRQLSSPATTNAIEHESPTKSKGRSLDQTTQQSGTLNTSRRPSPAKTPPRSRGPNPVRRNENREDSSRTRAHAADSSDSEPDRQARRPSKKSGQSQVIQDSEDEFLTPPTRNTSFVTCPSNSGSRRDSTHRGEDMSGQPMEGVLAVDTPTKRRLKSVNSDIAREMPTVVEDGPMELDGSWEATALEAPTGSDTITSSDSDGATLLTDLFMSNPAVIQKKRRLVDSALAKNNADYLRSLREKWPAERREQVKKEKDPLLKQREALDRLATEYRAHKSLVDEQEALLGELAEAYERGLDTEQDETRLDKLGLSLQKSERAVQQCLADAGIDATIFDDVTGSAESVENSHPEVLATQHSHARSSQHRDSVLVPECHSQVILQTQLHPRSQPSAAEDALEVGIPSASPEFPREPRQSTSRLRTNHMREATEARAQTTTFEQDLFDEADAFPDLDFPHPRPQPPVSSRMASARKRSPAKPYDTRSRPQECFSDFSDDIEMLQFAEDFEQRQSSGETIRARPPRAVFTETSGNATITPRARSASRKVSSSLPKAAIPPELMRHPWSEDVRRALKDRFRMSGFRHNQLEAINTTLDGKDSFILMPTGGGKSLCYQLPAVINTGKTHGVTIVISPLLSLMQDQVDHLQALNIRASSFNGEMPAQARNHVLDLFKTSFPENTLQLLYVTPEMINKSKTFINGLMNLYRNKKLARIVIDEAHCVSQWGHDFRPDYKALGEVRCQFPRVPVMALTATATPNVIVDIKHNLSIDGCAVFSQSFNRPNLYYEIRQKEKGAIDEIANMIKSKYSGQTGIVYTLSRKSAENIANKLREDHGIAAHHYHASIESADKTQIQRNWQSGKIKVVVATIAFGMGIDKADVRFVVHHYLPKSLEGYYQETGRAGRDGKRSDCILFFNYGDIKSLRNLISDSDGSEDQKNRQREMLNRVVTFCEDKRDCRRVEILRYFGEKFDKKECKGTCDNCKNGGTFQLKDYSEYAVGALQIIKAYRRMTLVQCAEVLMGKKRPEFDTLAQYHGLAKKLKKHEVHGMIYRLLAEDALDEENKVNRSVGIAIQYFSLGHTSQAFLAGRRKLELVTKVGEGEPGAPKPKKKAKKATALPPSTNVSSPVRGSTKKRKGQSYVLDQEDEEGDVEAGGPLHANGYEKDNFVVSDVDEDSDDGFAPMRRPPPKRRQQTLEELGGPISRDSRFDEANINELHADIILAFVEEAKQLEEHLRNEKGLRRVLFTEKQFREMAIAWTTTVDQMRRIPDINQETVDRFGSKFGPLVKKYQHNYREIMGHGAGNSAQRAGASGGISAQEIVDLISSDDDDLFDDEVMGGVPDHDGDDDDDDGDLDSSSKYFAPNEGVSAAQDRSAQEWHERMAQLSQNAAPARSKAGSSGAGKSGGSNWRGGGKKPFARRGGRGGSSNRSASGTGGGGVTKRRASGGARKASGGSSSGRGRAGARGGGRSSGGAGGGSGIGLMPM